ncbi:transforming growth factor-beta receptor-associated protein 1-like [Rhopilema esculentum]|uniref:transforming growth factor-beta receptor-associated protein 1-like n=1 Tax=Rhopilema esculentum TaxID=499914 RepID=UPI0031DE5AAD
MSLKAFDIVPVLDRVSLPNEKSKSLITCIDCSLKNLYIGTSDCFVVHYIVEKENSAGGKVVYQTTLQRYKQIGLKKSIQQILTCPAASKLLVLCDGNLFMLTMMGLEMKVEASKEIMKGATVMAKNNRPVDMNPFSVEVCIGTRKRSIQIWSVDRDKITVIKEIHVNEIPYLLAIDGQTICTALGNQYFLVNFSTGKIQELFMYEAHNTKPLVKVVGEEEFLLSGPTNTMGMIVTSEGLSQHQPLNWADGLSAIAYSYPYSLVLGNSTITVHSMLDQRQKQAIAFQGGIFIGDYENNNVFVSSLKAIYYLVPLPFDKQIQMLLIEKRVEEAIELSNVAHTLKPSEYNEKFLAGIQAQAGFVYFSQGHFSQASELFLESTVDVREVICLYPLLMPSNIIFQAARPTLHNIKDLNQVVKGNKPLMAEAKNFLLKLLENCRGMPLAYNSQMTEIDTALLKLYAECNHNSLLDFVTNENSSYYDDCVACLKQYKRYHALAEYYCCHKEPDKALETWKRIVDGQDIDLNFPGYDFIVEFISKLEDHELVWTYAPWILEKDSTIGVKIFTTRPDNEPLSDRLRPEAIVEYLIKFPNAMRIYLEYLVLERNIQKEKFHTHLALIYLDDVLKLMKERIPMPESLLAARQKLQNLLERSSLYRVNVLLSKIGNLELFNEIAILYGKLDNHEKALEILVHKVEDPSAAERYCIVTSEGKDPGLRKKLFHALLAVYLQSPGSGDAEIDRKPAMQLLNTYQADFDPLEVMQIIPDGWTVGEISGFLSGAVRKSLHTSRDKKLEASLSRSVYVKNRGLYIGCQNGAINVTDERTCAVCRKPFQEPNIAQYPNGTQCHVHCIDDKNVCPVTGTNFSKRVIVTR